MAQNVMISNQNEPNEPAIIIDPKHPNVLIAGTNLNNYYISTDTGRTWTENILTSSYGVWGDPTISVDTTGDFYFFHLSDPPPTGSKWIDRIICQKTTNRGASWSDGTYAGLNGTKAQDKQWCAVDRSNNNLYITWTQFDKYGSTQPTDSSIILFSKSSDAGNTWSVPKRINAIAGDCLDDDNTVEGAVPAVGPNGEIYVAWAGPAGLVFNKSTDTGNTWLAKEIVVDIIPGGWNFSVPGIFRANGLPVISCDVSNGPYRGTIYINWADQRNGSTDILMVKSTDGGKTWSPAKVVNNDQSNQHQFLTWMTIDQTNGYVYCVFYDRRNYTGLETDVYLAISMDGGNTFINRRISESPFVPNAGIFFGDYTNISVHNGIIRPIWTRLHNGKLSVWTNTTSLDKILSSEPEQRVISDLTAFENYPNPFCDYEFVSFKLHGKAIVNLAIYDMEGKQLATLINKEIRDYGKYVERIELGGLNLAPGSYFLRLEIDANVKVNRLIKM